MTDVLAQLVVRLNAVANALGGWLLAPVAVLPGWLSATLVAAVTGVLLLVAYKYTSNQRAIKRVRDDINAHLLALKLFKDSASVAVRAQGRILRGAGRLFLLSLVPMAVMAVPVILVLGQLSLWYQQRPLRVGEEAVVTLTLNGDAEAPMPEVNLEPSDAVDITVGPVRVLSDQAVCWNVRARANGSHRLVFRVGGQTAEKALTVGDGFMQVSARRPARALSEDLLWYPAEEPFGPDSAVRSIDVEYPERPGLASGSGWWLLYWFGVSMVAALCFRRVLNVNV
jgi:uncharacterized membrane protein (DUF106 family)